MTRRCFGLDVHREFAQVAIWQDGLVGQAGQIAMTPEGLGVFADSLAPTDEVALEATGNTHAIVRLLRGRVARVVVSNPHKTRAIAEAKVKTDKVDAEILAQLLAADYLPGVWVADEDTQARRRQVARRGHIVRQRTRLKTSSRSCIATWSRAARLRTCSGSRVVAGWPSRSYRPMSARRSWRCCASWTSTPTSCGSSTPSSRGSRWAVRTPSG